MVYRKSTSGPRGVASWGGRRSEACSLRWVSQLSVTARHSFGGNGERERNTPRRTLRAPSLAERPRVALGGGGGQAAYRSSRSAKIPATTAGFSPRNGTRSTGRPKMSQRSRCRCARAKRPTRAPGSKSTSTSTSPSGRKSGRRAEPKSQRAATWWRGTAGRRAPGPPGLEASVASRWALCGVGGRRRHHASRDARTACVSRGWGLSAMARGTTTATCSERAGKASPLGYASRVSRTPKHEAPSVGARVTLSFGGRDIVATVVEDRV